MKDFSSPCLKCIPPEDADYVLREVHKGMCGSHQGPAAIKKKAERAGYFWPTMLKDAEKLVKECGSCQRHANLIHTKGSELTTMAAPWPFDIWGMDILGPFPTATYQRKFLIVAVDFFTKWVEAEPVASITTDAMERFTWQNIITRFGIPHTLITDNGRQFTSHQFKKFCANWHIHHKTTSVEHPATNGQVELANRIILKRLKKRLDAAKGRWVDELGSVLWSYRTTEQTATKETPFALTYGHEAVIPAEIGIPSQRTEQYPHDNDKDNMLQVLDGLDERREMAEIRQHTYNQMVAKYHDKNIKRRTIKVGDLVLREVANNRVDPRHGKLGPNWEGPYRVTAAMPGSAYRLETTDGRPLPSSWNISKLKFYFPSPDDEDNE